ncbi:TRAP transporter small permease [Pikeienuella piscinae]|uniref:TRAP transporter small permease protein n=1 Tax=Pikeienuella piscinae TaxID=2748098 RepID=A0A7L5BT70_9RHOB|nr:TRAP transporter small permease [Pikeienuella piscinae]QIE54705.1 TRAP transporter small permease [Pikeienuella piscinae]
MAGHSSVREDSSALSRADRALFRVESGLNLAAGVVVFALMLLAVAQIMGRKLFNVPVPGFIDWVEQAMAVFAFLGIAYCQRVGGHIRMDILIGRLTGRALWVAELISTVLMLLLTLALTVGAFRHFQRAFDWNATWFSRDSSIDIALPLWPAKLLVPLALGLLALRLALQIWGFWRALRDDDDAPVAVPLIESAAEVAAAEAETVIGEPVGERERG